MGEKIIQVKWVDSHTGNDWVPIDQACRIAAEASALEMTSVGYLVADEPDYILLAGTFSPPTVNEKGLVNNTMQIPRVAIVDITPLYKRQTK